MRPRWQLKLGIAALLLGLGAAVWPLAVFAQFGSVNSDGVTLHGVPPSVTSFGFGGVPGFHGVPPSVTSPGFGRPTQGLSHRPFDFRRRRRPGLAAPFYGGTYPYYYAPDSYPYDVMDLGVDDSMEEEYRGGPTIFDRRGYGAPEYRRSRAPQPEATDRSDISASAPAAAAQPEQLPEQPSTVLVFKDGHQLEISNYAIVDTTLYDLGGGRTHKVALTELDLASTVKENNQRGVDFRLPNGVKPN